MFVRPSFYDNFRCKAGACNDSCCIGWEIDIDESTLKKYSETDGEFGEQLKNSIVSDGEFYFFKLTEDEKCPFLNKSGLCDIYINLGEDGLCDICSEHPRFYNQYGDITEAGLGLCCEKVCEMIFDSDYKLEFISDGYCDELSSDEKFLLELRSKLFDMINSSDKHIFEKMNEILSISASVENREDVFHLNYDETIKNMVLTAFSKTEPINEEWSQYISELCDNCTMVDIVFDNNYEKLLSYLIYRYFLNAVYDGELYLWTLFCCLSVFFVYLCDCKTYCTNKRYTIDDRIQSVKRFSKQIEYSTENINILIENIL